MKFTETKLKGCFILEPKIFKDERGYFMESFNERTFQEGIGQKVTFVQDNQSFSTRGVLRGLHYQCGEHAQAKLVRVLQGEVLDVAVDLRLESPTYGQYETVLLSGENQKQFFVPRGFAHGFFACRALRACVAFSARSTLCPSSFRISDNRSRIPSSSSTTSMFAMCVNASLLPVPRCC